MEIFVDGYNVKQILQNGRWLLIPQWAEFKIYTVFAGELQTVYVATSCSW